ncbi:collagen-like protein [Parasegetibacter sp. NRK P23]|uniref:collagen-like protein n=1 Tax=Parasegetibacter sp. NRK P23 TaxID=2942999 RepID=UPI0020442A2F|nr:collagen-like protein [Parasegetibacter sp. NRK P23]MCM5530471.1 collagen-like protein [Parasegetibacter sp. NRK P23]
MKPRLLKLICLAFSVSLLFTSCAKDGEQGPQGEQGEQGPAGPAGPTGATGPAGTANVIYSGWLNATYDEDDFVAVLAAPKLTKDILDKGEIKVYWNLGDANDPFIVSLPARVSPLLLFSEETLEDIFGTDPAPTIQVDAYFSTGEIVLASNYGPLINSSGGVAQYRYVLIPGGTQARTAEGKSIDWNDYKQVKAYLGLKD